MYEIGDRDYDLIARTILGEAANEPFAGKAAVANVILNRLKAGNYGSSIPEVLFAPKQFEPWNTRRSQLLSYGPQTKGWDEAMTIAKTVGRGMAPDPTGGALNFLNRDYSAKRGDSAMRSGGWGNNLQNPIQIGAHTFGTAAGAGTGREGRIRVASADPNFVPGGARPAPAAVSPTMPMGGLGGLGGYQPPTGMQTFGDVLQALGMSLLSSPSNNMFQALPQTYTAIQGRRGKEAERAQEAERWATEFGLKRQDLEARRAEQAIDNARQERALKVTEGNAATSAKTEMQRLMELNHPDLKPGTQAYFDAYKAIKQAGVSGETFGAPTFVNRGGKTYAVQYGSQGTVKENEVSGELNKPEQTTRLGTKVRIRNADGSISYEDIDVAGEAAGKVQGKFSGEQLAEAPGNLSRIQAARQELAGIKADPRRAGTTGWWAGIGGHNIPATDAYDFANKVAKAKAGAFTQGLQALKGFGPVTELEGKTAAKAVERMELASSDREFETALDEYEAALAAAEEKVQRVLQGRANPAPMTPRPGAGSGGPGRVRYDANGNRM
jgi:hypothetical protein